MITEYDWKTYKEAADFLDLFGCDCGLIGYYYFVELVYAIRAKWREEGEKCTCIIDICAEMLRRYGTFYRAFWTQTRRAVLPVLAADDSELKAYGIELKKRTSSELAYALADLLEKP